MKQRIVRALLLTASAACISVQAQVPLATNQGAPGNLVVDGARVYWLDRQSGAVRSVDKVNGGAVMTHSNGNAAPGWVIQQDDVFLYYSADGKFPAGGPTAIFKVPKTSASVTQVSSNDIEPPFAMNAGTLYYVGTFRQVGNGGNSDALVSMSTQGGPETVLLWNRNLTNVTPNFPLGGETSFTTDGNYLYWSSHNGGASGVFHMPLVGGAVATNASTPNTLASVTVPNSGATSSYAFWVDMSANQLMMQPPGGGAVPILANINPVSEYVQPFTVIGSDVYAGQNGAIMKLHISGSSASAPTVVLPAPAAFPVSMVNDCTTDGPCHLYWSDLLNGGAIEKVAINASGTGPQSTPVPTATPTSTPTPTPQPPTGPLFFKDAVTWKTPDGKTAVLTAKRITNTAASGSRGPIRLELWAFPNANTGAPMSGYRTATYSLPSLDAGASYTDVDSGPITFTPPPNGWWHMSMLLTELTNTSSADDGYSYDDWVNFAQPYVVGGSAAPTPTPAQLANISTRGVIRSGDSVMIGGFIVTGSAQKKVIVRGIGPSLPVNGALADPVLELHSSNALLASNDNWQDSQASDITATGVAPTNNLEPALIATLAGNNAGYTAVLSGKNAAAGIGLIEVYDLSTSPTSALANISTRGFVDVGDNVMIGGFITSPGTGAAKILIRGIGPSLSAAGVSGALADPMLELHDANGATIASNDNWKDSQQSEIQATGIPPSSDAESAIVQTLWAGNYTAVLRGKSNSSGVGLVEIYNLR